MAQDEHWQRATPESRLFTVRVWLEVGEHGKTEPRLQVRDVLSGETRYFSNAPALLAYLLAKVPPRADGESTTLG
jgi:hypothetical protein